MLMKAEAVLAFEHRLRGLLSRVLPHEQFIKVYSRARTWYLDMLASSKPEVEIPKYPVNVNGIRFRNDLGNAAGFDKDGKLLPFSFLSGAGFGVSGTFLSEPWQGNLISAYGKDVNPWVPLYYSDSAVNTLGLPSHGIDAGLKNIREFRWKYQPVDFPIVISVMEHPKYKKEPDKARRSLIACAGKALQEADVLEVNVSCPNTGHKEETEQIRRNLEDVVALRDSASTKDYVPIFVKVRDFGENPEFAIEFFHNLGIDGISGVNSQINYIYLADLIDKRDLSLYEHYTSKYKGGVTGRAIRDLSFKEISNASRVIEKSGSKLQLVHVGGLGEHADIAESRKIKVVRLRQWYTRMFKAMERYSMERVYPEMVGN